MINLHRFVTYFVLLIAGLLLGPNAKADLIFNLTGTVNSSDFAGLSVGSSFNLQLTTNSNPVNSLNNANAIFWHNSSTPFVSSSSMTGWSGPPENVVLAGVKSNNGLFLNVLGGVLNGESLGSLAFSVPGIPQLVNTPVDGMRIEDVFKAGTLSAPIDSVFSGFSGAKVLSGTINLVSISQVTAVPEPSSFILLASGAVGLIIRRRRGIPGLRTREVILPSLTT